MEQRKVFWTHPVLLIEGRFACFLLLGAVVFFNGWPVYEWLSTGTVNQWGWSLALAIMISVPSFFFLRFLWPQCFNRLILTDDAVIWRCLFMRPRKIGKDECRYVGIKEAMMEWRKGNWVSTGTQWVWFSNQAFPEEKNISQLRTQKGFIKFPLSIKLCGALGEWLPEPKNLPFQSRYEKELLEKKHRKERRQRKREKNLKRKSCNK